MCEKPPLFFTLLLVSLVFISASSNCDLERFVRDGRRKEISPEESTLSSGLVFRGLTIVATPRNEVGDGYVAYFELINTYKGAEQLETWSADDFRRINVTLEATPSMECLAKSAPREYIVFCNFIGDELRAVSVAKWNEETDQRIWRALGWGKWSDWSSCSVSCSAGIQQRTRKCRIGKCPGFNVEQRHCNMFGCALTVDPLSLADEKYFHPSKKMWQNVPGRPTAYRMKPNSYIWVQTAMMFPEKSFPKEFALFVTVRLTNETIGTLFSLRSRSKQDTYISLEVAGSDLKLIHAASNGTDVVLIPAALDDRKWHQIAISLRDDSVVESYVDCQWTGKDILRRNTLEIPDDSDLIIGYLFDGDLEQMSITTDPLLVSLQCSSLVTPIMEPTEMK